MYGIDQGVPRSWLNTFEFRVVDWSRINSENPYCLQVFLSGYKISQCVTYETDKCSEMTPYFLIVGAIFRRKLFLLDPKPMDHTDLAWYKQGLV